MSLTVKAVIRRQESWVLVTNIVNALMQMQMFSGIGTGTHLA